MKPTGSEKEAEAAAAAKWKKKWWEHAVIRYYILSFIVLTRNG